MFGAVFGIESVSFHFILPAQRGCIVAIVAVGDMGQESYALLKLKSKIPQRIQDQLKFDEGLLEPYLVKNVSAPGALVWTGINYRSLQADDEEARETLKEQVLSAIPSELLRLNNAAKGILLFADGGESQKSWPNRATYEEIVSECTQENGEGIEGFSIWLKISPEKLIVDSNYEGDDSFLSELDPIILMKILDARKSKDLSRIRKILKENLKNYQKRLNIIDIWLRSLDEE